MEFVKNCPLKSTDTVNAPGLLTQKDYCNHLKIELLEYHLHICSLGKFVIFYYIKGFERRDFLHIRPMLQKVGNFPEI